MLYRNYLTYYIWYILFDILTDLGMGLLFFTYYLTYYLTYWLTWEWVIIFHILFDILYLIYIIWHIILSWILFYQLLNPYHFNKLFKFKTYQALNFTPFFKFYITFIAINFTTFRFLPLFGRWRKFWDREMKLKNKGEKILDPFRNF